MERGRGWTVLLPYGTSPASLQTAETIRNWLVPLPLQVKLSRISGHFDLYINAWSKVERLKRWELSLTRGLKTAGRVDIFE